MKALEITTNVGCTVKCGYCPQEQLINAYGPTEATVDVTYYNCSTPDSPTPDIVPIGKPIANTRILILDKTGDLQPIGIPGELCISGDCLAMGYLNNPEQTAEKFV